MDNKIKVYNRVEPGYCPCFVQAFSSCTTLEAYLQSQGGTFSDVYWTGVEGRVANTSLVLVEEADDFASHASHD